MLEAKLEEDIRKHLVKRFHVFMKHYTAQVIIHRQFPYHMDIIYENKKTNSQIYVSDVFYDIYKKGYIIGEIKLLMKEEQELEQEKLNERTKNNQRAPRTVAGTQ